MSTRLQRFTIAAGIVGSLLITVGTTVSLAATSCPELADWIDSALGDGRIPVRRAAIAWTGNEALIWGGEVGYRFDPAQSSWQPMSTVGAPGGYAPLSAWTGAELLVWGGTLSSATVEVDTNGGRYSALDDTWNPIASVGAPAGRRDAASAWTGTEWVIWGGRDAAGTSLSDGGVYDAAADVWAAPTATAAPAARYAHTMTWTDGEVLLFGGRSGGTRYADLHAYDAAGDVWTSLGSPPGEIGRSGHVAVWTGTYLLIYGGEQNGVGAVNTGWRYRVSNGQWTAMSTVDAPAAGATTRAAWTGDAFLVWSGDGAAAGSYDPVNNSWSAVSAIDAPAARVDHSVAWLDDRLLVWGGGVADGGTYDPALGEWTSTDPVLVTRPMRNHTAVWTGSEVLFWGGQLAADHAEAGGYRYDPATDGWSTITSVGAPSARRFHTAVWSGSEMIVWGGQDATTSTLRLDDGGRYDPSSDSWTPLTPVGPPAARTHHAAVWTGAEMIVWGGWVGTARDVTASGGRYDPSSDSWTPLPTADAPVGSRDPQVVWTGARMVVWSGGVDQPDTTVAYATTGAAYDPLTDDWSPIADAAGAGIEGRMMAVAAWAGDEVLIWGGLGDPDTLATGGRYDPLTDSWTAMSALGAPGDRRKAVGVWTGDALLIYGGQSGNWFSSSTYLDDGGFYLPASDTWIPLAVAPPLGPRSLHAGAWTGDRLVTFGGQSDGGTHNAGGVLLVGLDADGDSTCDSVDNCVGLANPDQADLDFDVVGDACDICPATPDPDQIDSDLDGVGDACAWCSDPDGDEACDAPTTTAGDRCPGAFNPSGRKIVLTGSPFDGLEVTRSFLRTAGDGAPLLVVEGDLAVDETLDLFVQRPTEDLTLTPLGVSAAAGPAGYTLDGVYAEVAVFLNAISQLFGVALEGGAPPNRVEPLPAGYEISRTGTKVVFEWTAGEVYPCEFYFDPAFVTIETTTGLARCFGVNAADQTIADWYVSSDRGWVIYLLHDFNSSVVSSLTARHLDSGFERGIDSSDFVGGVSLFGNDFRDDGQALLRVSYADDGFSDISGLLVGSAPRILGSGFDPNPSGYFSDQGDAVVVLVRRFENDAIVTDLRIGSLDAHGAQIVEDPSVDGIDAVRFAPGEGHFGFTDTPSTALYITPATAGGPVVQVATGGNAIVEFGFSPDATTLLYTEERAGDQARELWAVPLAGGAPSPIGPSPAGGASGVAAWTFAGGRLLVHGGFDGTTMQLYSMQADGSDLRSIDLEDPSDSVTQFWTGFDDGVVLRSDGSAQLAIAPYAGGTATSLTVPGIEDAPSDPQIASDGSFLIYDAQIAGADRETVLLLTNLADQDGDGILDPCDCLPADPAVGQSPGLVELSFTDASTLEWDPDGVSDAWTIYRGDLASLPGDAGTCLIEGHTPSSWVDAFDPPAGTGQIYLVAGDTACGTGQVAPRSNGEARNVVCP